MLHGLFVPDILICPPHPRLDKLAVILLVPVTDIHEGIAAIIAREGCVSGASLPLAALEEAPRSSKGFKNVRDIKLRPINRFLEE